MMKTRSLSKTMSEGDDLRHSHIPKNQENGNAFIASYFFFFFDQGHIEPPNIFTPQVNHFFNFKLNIFYKAVTFSLCMETIAVFVICLLLLPET